MLRPTQVNKFSKYVLPLGLVLIVVIFGVPDLASAKIPFFGPIIPEQYNVCAASWGMVITVINNIISLALTLLVVIIAPLMIAYAGFRLLISGGNPGARGEARKLLTNIVVGIIVALCSYLIVAALMAVLYHPTDAPAAGRTWSELVLRGGVPPCIPLKASLNQTDAGGDITGRQPDGSPIVTGGTAKGVCAEGNTACSVTAIKDGAQTLGMSLSDAQASTMSCIAMTESSGNANTEKSSTGACGTFQITTQPGNWSMAEFHRSPCSSATSCNNATCNLQTALLMYKQRGYQPWTGKNPTTGVHWNPNAVACAQKYDPNGRI